MTCSAVLDRARAGVDDGHAHSGGVGGGQSLREAVEVGEGRDDPVAPGEPRLEHGPELAHRGGRGDVPIHHVPDHQRQTTVLQGDGAEPVPLAEMSLSASR